MESVHELRLFRTPRMVDSHVILMTPEATMTLAPRSDHGMSHRPRVGLVLGAGGVLGAAWMAGALAALQERWERPLHEADMIVGTSAGSVLAAALSCRVGIADIVAHQRGAGLVALPPLTEIDRESGPLPPLPRMRLGSPRLLAAAARAPHRVHPWVAASALMPQGRGRHRTLTDLVHGLLSHAGHGPAQVAGVWPSDRVWIVSVDYHSGRRVAFGRPGAPPASLPDAVVASCSIPGWYEPKMIDQRQYVDGGVRSSTSLDLLAKVPLDEVYVLAPLASFHVDNPRNPAVRAERLVRRMITRGLAREARKVQASGARVTVLTPGPEDLAAMGINVMDPARRQQVLETSLLTSPVRLPRAWPGPRVA
jgi:NTE family protein